MQLLSQEAELELLTKIDEHLAKRLELAKKDNDDFDLISRSELLKKLDISSTTLRSW